MTENMDFGFGGDEFLGKTTIIPYCQFVNSSAKDFGIAITSTNAELAQFELIDGWQPVEHEFADGAKETLLITQTPKLLVLNRSQPLMANEHETIPYNKAKSEEGYKAFSYCVVWFLDDNLKPISELPFRLKCSEFRLGAKIMAKIHSVLGDKGGIGKSLICRTAVQYHLDRELEFALFDADRSNPDVKRIYSQVGCKAAVFSENEKYEDQANSIYFSAINKSTLVNFPAQIFNPFKNWLEKNNLFDLAPEDGVEFVLWFVCNGGYDSLELLKKHFVYFNEKVNYVLVKNWGLCDDWESLDNNDYLLDKINEYNVKVLNFPKFIGNRTKNTIDAESLTFGAAREYGEFNSIDRQRVKSFLKKAYQAFDEVGVFQSSNQLNELVGEKKEAVAAHRY